MEKKIIKLIVFSGLFWSVIGHANETPFKSLDVHNATRSHENKLSFKSLGTTHQATFKTIRTIRLIAQEPQKFAALLQERMGFKSWYLGALPTGEKIVSILLKSGQSIEIVSHKPSYARIAIDRVKSLTLGIEIDSIKEVSHLLGMADVPLFPALPIHMRGDPKQAKMFELLFVAAPDYPFNSLHFIKPFQHEIKKIQLEHPELDDRPWRDQSNGVVAISSVWLATNSIPLVEKAFFRLGLLDKVKQEEGMISYQIGDVLMNVISPEYGKMSSLITERLNKYGPGIFRLEFVVEPTAIKSDRQLTTQENKFIFPGVDTEFVFHESNKNIMTDLSL